MITKPIRTYSEQLLKTLQLKNAKAVLEARPGGSAAILDGEVSSLVREFISVKNLRKNGIFFTSSNLSQRVVTRFRTTLNAQSVILDPACGGGDLLLASAAMLKTKGSFNCTLEDWSDRLLGRDVVPEFIDIARRRLTVAALMRSTNDHIEKQYVKKAFENVKLTTGAIDVSAIVDATHIVLNPPFTSVRPQHTSVWGSGKINFAAEFLSACVHHARDGTQIVAILPDVLRSGSRYVKWREMISSHSRIHSIERYGRFDEHTDVEVFLLHLVREKQKSASVVEWQGSQKKFSSVVGDYFNCHVGAVVHYRDPHLGQFHPFVAARTLAPWSVTKAIRSHRRFKGRLFKPPFVVLRRTSSVHNQCRTLAAVVTGERPVAVENHLIVLIPKDGKVNTCKRLMKFFQTRFPSEWMNERIRCLHLTVSAVSELPWSEAQ